MGSIFERFMSSRTVGWRIIRVAAVVGPPALVVVTRLVLARPPQCILCGTLRPNTGDPGTGDYDDEPKVLFRSGRIPPELDV